MYVRLSQDIALKLFWEVVRQHFHIVFYLASNVPFIVYTTLAKSRLEVKALK